MTREYTHDAPIVFVDPHGRRHSAFATAWWGAPGATHDGDVFGNPPQAIDQTGEPGCNLVYVSKDLTEKDSCGRQMKRATSVVHKSRQPAGGNFWCWPDEL